jgi:hypothetical protein
VAANLPYKSPYYRLARYNIGHTIVLTKSRSVSHIGDSSTKMGTTIKAASVQRNTAYVCGLTRFKKIY